MTNRLNVSLSAVCGCFLVFCLLGGATTGPDSVGRTVATTAIEPASSVIVQGQDLETVKRSVAEVGGTVTHDLEIIRPVGGTLTPSQLSALGVMNGIERIYANTPVTTAAKKSDGNSTGGSNTPTPTIRL